MGPLFALSLISASVPAGDFGPAWTPPVIYSRDWIETDLTAAECVARLDAAPAVLFEYPGVLMVFLTCDAMTDDNAAVWLQGTRP